MAVDVVITRAGPVAIPLDYTVPNGTELIPRTISATINGAAAAGDFVPVLEVIAPSGAVTAYCARRVSIAAGASVLASWFPGVAEADETAAAAGITSVNSSAGTVVVTSPTGPTVSLDLPASGVTAGSYGDASDAPQITVDAYGRITAATSVPIAGGGAVVASDGWVPDTTETWTFASFAAGPPAAGTFTVPGDLRSKYTVGTRIKLVQTTTKYFVVTADPTFAAGVTTVTISGGTDYTLANAAISANYHSYVVNPQGFPTFFNFAAGQTGFSGAPTVQAIFAMEGRNVTIQLFVSGTSSTTSLGIVLPVAPDGSNYATTIFGGAIDNGASQTAPAAIQIGSAATSINIGKTFGVGAGSWTAALTKRFQGGGSYKA